MGASMRSLNTHQPLHIRKRFLFTLWLSEGASVLALLICSLSSDVTISEHLDPNNSEQEQKIVLSLLAILAFIATLVHGAEITLYLFHALKANAFIGFEIGKNIVIEPAWALVMWRCAITFRGTTLEPLIFVALAWVACVHYLPIVGHAADSPQAHPPSDIVLQYLRQATSFEAGRVRLQQAAFFSHAQFFIGKTQT